MTMCYVTFLTFDIMIIMTTISPMTVFWHETVSSYVNLVQRIIFDIQQDDNVVLSYSFDI